MIYILFLPWPKEGFASTKTIEEEELCVEFPIVEVGGVFKEYELDKVQPLTQP